MFYDGLPISPLPFDPITVPIGPEGQVLLSVLLYFSLIAIAYFLFEICAVLMSEQFWIDIERLQARRVGKKWWQL